MTELDLYFSMLCNIVWLIIGLIILYRFKKNGEI